MRPKPRSSDYQGFADLFLAQAQMALMTVDGLVVVLLESGQAVSRVVFFWEALDNADGPGSANLGMLGFIPTNRRKALRRATGLSREAAVCMRR